MARKGQPVIVSEGFSRGCEAAQEGLERINPFPDTSPEHDRWYVGYDATAKIVRRMKKKVAKRFRKSEREVEEADYSPVRGVTYRKR